MPMTDDEYNQKLKLLGLDDSNNQNASYDPSLSNQPAPQAPAAPAQSDRLQKLLTGEQKPETPEDNQALQTYLASDNSDNSDNSAKPATPTPAPGFDGSPEANPNVPVPSMPEDVPSAGPVPTPSNVIPNTHVLAEDMPAANPVAPVTTPNLSNPLDNPEVNDQALKRAQQGVSQKNLITNLGNAFGDFAATAAGNKFDPTFYNDMLKQNQQPVADIEARRAAMQKSVQTASAVTDLAVKNMSLADKQRMDDATSPQSAGIKRLIEHYEPWLSKDPNWQKMNGNEALQATKYLESEAKIQASKATRDAAQGYKSNQELDKHQKDYLTSLTKPEISSGFNAAIPSEIRKFNQATRIDQIAEQAKANGGKIAPEFMTEYVQGVNNLLTNSNNASVAVFKKLMPNNKNLSMARVSEYVTGNPQVVNQQGWLDAFQKLSDREKGVSAKIITAYNDEVYDAAKNFSKGHLYNMDQKFYDQAHNRANNRYAAYIPKESDQKTADKNNTGSSSTPGSVPQAQSNPPAGKVHVSNGKEAYYINPSDLDNAKAEGFNEVQ